jgi:hypothetical protein
MAHAISHFADTYNSLMPGQNLFHGPRLDAPRGTEIRWRLPFFDRISGNFAYPQNGKFLICFVLTLV